MMIESPMSKKWLSENSAAIKQGDFDITKIALNDNISIENPIDADIFWPLINRWLKSEGFI